MKAEKQLGETNVFEFASTRLGRLQDVHLDLGVLQPDLVAASVLTGVLLTSAADTPIWLKLPPNMDRGLLARNGLLFALANRRGPVHMLPELPHPPSYLDEWKRPWTRGTRAPLLPLGRVDEGTLEPSVFGPGYAAFVNPHRAGGVRGCTSGVAEVVRPWLHEFLPGLTTETERTTAGPEFIQSIGKLIDELVENVVEHAARGRSLEVFSLVLVSLTRGGEQNARYRLHISVFDTGPGILDTAAKKIEAARAPELWTQSRKELFGGLFRGEIKKLGRARGYGLPHVWETVRRWEGGRLVAVANGHRVRSTKTCLRVDEVAPVLDGSLVSVMFPLPPRCRGSEVEAR